MKKYYFAMLVNHDPIAFIIVGKQFWKENKAWDDSGDEVENLPDGFYELEESAYEYEGDSAEGFKKLIEAGFIENNDLKFDLEENNE